MLEKQQPLLPASNFEHEFSKYTDASQKRIQTLGLHQKMENNFNSSKSTKHTGRLSRDTTQM